MAQAPISYRETLPQKTVKEKKRKEDCSQAWWSRAAILILGRLMHKECLKSAWSSELQVSQSNIVTIYLKINNQAGEMAQLTVLE